MRQQQQFSMLADLLARANGGDPLSVIADTGQLLSQSGWSTVESFELWRTRCRAQFRADDYVAGLRCTDEMSALAAQDGNVGRILQALGHRAEAHVNLKDINAALDVLLEAEVILAGRLDVDAEIARSRYGLANSYTDLSFYELAVSHCRDAVEQLIELGTHPEYLATATLNLAIMELDWAVELYRTGTPAAEVDVQRALVDQAREHLRGHQLMPAAYRGGLDARCAEFQAIADAFVDPRGGRDAIARILQEHPFMDRNDRAYMTAALARAHRLSGHFREAVDVAREAMDLLGDPGVFPNTARGVLHELHQAQIASRDGEFLESDQYVRACEQALWEHRLNALQGFLARRDLHRMAIDRERHRAIARQDPLTGALNRRALTDWLTAHPMGPAFLAVIDVDQFKTFNDNYGHDAGDAVLCALADNLRAAVRSDDMVVRYGGDEFVIVGRGSLSDAARLRTRIHAGLPDPLPELPAADIRVSVGIAAVGSEHPTSGLVTAADADMFVHKRGR